MRRFLLLPRLRVPLPPLLVALAAASCAGGADPIPYSSLPSGDRAGADERPVLDLGSAESPLPDPGAEPKGLAPEGPDPVLAVVDGAEVRAGEVARYLLRFNPSPALEGLDQILDERMLEADAREAGVVLPEGELEARTEEEVRNREKDVRVNFGPDVTLDRFLKEKFGTTREAFRRDTAGLVRLWALRDRLARYEALREDSLRIRILVIEGEGKARDAAASLRAGADFAALARQVSVAPVEELPPYRREEIQPPALSEELFAMAAGEVSRPVRWPRDGKDLYWVFKVVERRPGREVSYAEAAGEIERGLSARPVGAAERLQWARRARERHGVKYLLVEPSR